MTVQELARLITAYGWLSQELAAQTEADARANRAHIRAEMDAIFLKIVQSPADSPYIGCAQIDFLVSAMGEPGRDDETRALLCDIIRKHLRQLSKTLRGRDGGPSLKSRPKTSGSGLRFGRYTLRTGSA
jgi:hypothetical protein